MSDFSFPYKTLVLKVEQRLGIFYVATLPAELLLQVSASHRLKAIKNEHDKGYSLAGTQRPIKHSRLNEIAQYIDRIDSVFPNSIVLAANHNFDTGFDQDEHESVEYDEENHGSQDNSDAWTIEESKNHYVMTIPSPKKLAAVIDGQHRLFSFAMADVEIMKKTHLLCSVFLDLPKPLQAQIFATINSTQKRVDRSLTFELFGYNISDEDVELWTPDKLAVFLTRKLGTDEESPLRGKIKVAPKHDKNLKELASEASWFISTATVVDGFLRLFSSNPKRDSNIMRKGKAHSRQKLLEVRDNSPLRDIFIGGNDLLIYTMVLNYLKASNKTFWENAPPDSFIIRTIGVQAIFDILRLIAKDAIEEKNVRVEYFMEKLKGAQNMEFPRKDFDSSSGSGRTKIRKAIEEAINLNN